LLLFPLPPKGEKREKGREYGGRGKKEEVRP